MHTKRRVVKGYKRFIMAGHSRIYSLRSGEQTSISIPKLESSLGWVGFGVVKLTCDQAVLLPRKRKKPDRRLM